MRAGSRSTFLVVASVLVLFPSTRNALGGEWKGMLAVAVVRSDPRSYSDRELHDRLSITTAAFRRLSPYLSLGPEIGYHGFESIVGLQSGPEWSVDSDPGTLRAGAWELAALFRLEGAVGGLHPYLVAGGGPYAAGNFVIESREAKIEHHFQPAVTAGVGLRYGCFGLEGRWHYVQNGLGIRQYTASGPTFSYEPLRLYSLSICLYFP